MPKTTHATPAAPQDVLALAARSGAKMVVIKFVDTFGVWQHFSCPIDELTDEVFAEGLGFDGSPVHPGMEIDRSLGHAGLAGPGDGPHRSRSAPSRRSP